MRTPVIVNPNTGQAQPVIFKLNNPSRYVGGSLKNANPFERVPPQYMLSAVSRVKYFPTKEEQEKAKKEGKTLLSFYIKTAYYKNGKAGYIEDLNLSPAEEKEFIASLDKILFAGSYDVDTSFVPVRVVSPNEQELLWYLRTCSFNQDASTRDETEHAAVFYEFKPQDIAAKQVVSNRKSVAIANRLIEALEGDDDKKRQAVWTQYLATGYSLGVDIFGIPDMVERQILNIINQNPEAFEAAMNNHANYIMFVLKMAQQASIVTIDPNSNGVRWASSNQPIVSFPIGFDVYTEYAKWAQTSEGMPVHSQIFDMYKKTQSAKFVNFSAEGLTANLK